jgi:hypothetical protein
LKRQPGEIFAPRFLRTTIVTTIMMACAYAAAFGAIQQMPRVVPGLPELQGMARTAQEQTISGVQSLQEFGGLIGRILLALLAARIVGRRRLLYIFQVPGMIMLPILFLLVPSVDSARPMGHLRRDGHHRPIQFGATICGVLTYLRGTGESRQSADGCRHMCSAHHHEHGLHAWRVPIKLAYVGDLGHCRLCHRFRRDSGCRTYRKRCRLSAHSRFNLGLARSARLNLPYRRWPIPPPAYTAISMQTSESTPDAASQEQVQQARTALDTWVREVVGWHFDPATGSPFWLDRAKTLGWDPRREITKFSDLRRFGPFEDEWLRGGPVRRWVPRGLAGKPVFVFETGGTTATPKTSRATTSGTDYELFSATRPTSTFRWAPTG